MLNYSDRLDRVFQALADSTRRAMVEHLARTPASVSELAAPFDMSMPAIVQHLKVLENAGIVASHKVGRVRTVQLVPDALRVGRVWIDEQKLPAERQLDRLGAVLAADDITTKEN
jgi:DNA-binding transcriptional ArsR family regulator